SGALPIGVDTTADVFLGMVNALMGHAIKFVDLRTIGMRICPPLSTKDSTGAYGHTCQETRCDDNSLIRLPWHVPRPGLWFNCDIRGCPYASPYRVRVLAFLHGCARSYS